MVANGVQARVVASFDERNNLGIVALQNIDDVLLLVLNGPGAHLFEERVSFEEGRVAERNGGEGLVRSGNHSRSVALTLSFWPHPLNLDPVMV